MAEAGDGLGSALVMVDMDGASMVVAVDELPLELRGKVAGYLDAVARHRDGGFQQPAPWQLTEFLVRVPETGHGTRHARRQVAIA